MFFSLCLLMVPCAVADNNSFRLPSDAIDFRDCTTEEDGRCCIITTSSSPTTSRQSVLECNHKNITSCHYTYITVFRPHQETVCSEHYEKKCQITFHKKSVSEKVRKCYKPLKKVCSPSENAVEGDQICRTYHETSCTSKYVEKSAAKFVGHSSCRRIPRVLCGSGCRFEESAEECHEKDVDTITDTPEESCDLTPVKTCHAVTKLTPLLTPKQKCTVLPQEVCSVRLSNPAVVDRTRVMKWCRETGEDVSADVADDKETGEDVSADVGDDKDRKSKSLNVNVTVLPKRILQQSNTTRKSANQNIVTNEIEVSQKHKQQNMLKHNEDILSVVEMDQKELVQKLSQMLPPPPPIERKIIGIGSSFAFKPITIPGHIIHQWDEKLDKPDSQEIPLSQPKSGKLNRQPKKTNLSLNTFENHPTKDSKVERAKTRNHSRPGSRRSYLPKQDGDLRPVNKHISSQETIPSQPESSKLNRKPTKTDELPQTTKSGRKHSRPESRKSYLPKQSATERNVHNAPPQLLPPLLLPPQLLPPQLLPTQIFHPPFVDKNAIKEINRNQTNTEGKKHPNYFKGSHSNHADSTQKSRKGKSYLPSSNKNDRKTSKKKGENKTKQAKHKSYLPKQNGYLPKQRGYLPTSHPKHKVSFPSKQPTSKTKSTPNVKVPQSEYEDDLPFYSIPSKFLSDIPDYARPSPGGLSALAIFSQRNYEQYREV